MTIDETTPAATSATTLSWDDVPAFNPKHAATRSGSTGFMRRSFLKGAAALAGGVALNAFGALGGVGVKKASAYTEWYDCAGYGGWPGYDDNTYICVGGYYSSWYCYYGWFYEGWGWDGNYYMPMVACGEGGYSARNGWRWMMQSRDAYRCSDGAYYYWDSYWGDWYGVFRICSYYLGTY